MATRSANISVVPFGDGPQVAIGDLVGAKTVLLSGPFQGSYTPGRGLRFRPTSNGSQHDGLCHRQYFRRLGARTKLFSDFPPCRYQRFRTTTLDRHVCSRASYRPRSRR